MTTTNTTANEVKYFDLHTTGIGYLGRVREVKLKKGQPFWACTIAAMHGECTAADSGEKPDYTYFDCNVVGAEAQRLIKRCAPAVAAGKKVLVGFVIGDIHLDRFVYVKGEKKGETGVSLKGRLLRIRWIKIDGVMQWQEPPKDAQQSPSGPDHAQTTEHQPAPASQTARQPDTSSLDEEEGLAGQHTEETEAECV